MAKLHQLLAVEADLEGKYKRICEESKKTFGKPAMFMGYHRKLESFSDDAPEWPEENQEMATTVHDRIKYTQGHIESYLDALAQKESTNQVAVADLVVRGTTLATAVPATFLLGLESRLKYVRGVYEALPTLQAGTEWKLAPDKGANIFAMVHPEEKLKTELTFKSQVITEAQFPPAGRAGNSIPAQFEKWQEQLPVGKFVKNVWCGMITTAEKSRLLDNIDTLIRATKMARQKANSTEVKKVQVGQAIMDFINT